MEDIKEDIKKISRSELYSRLEAFKGGKWIYSPEYAELNRRLDTFTIKRLEDEGYDIPNGMRQSDVKQKKIKTN